MSANLKSNRGAEVGGSRGYATVARFRIQFCDASLSVYAYQHVQYTVQYSGLLRVRRRRTVSQVELHTGT